MDVNLGGATLKFPDGTPDAAISKAIADFRRTPEFDALVDKKAGAPARVRMIVGAAAEQDRLPNLKKFFPDAVPYGTDNFVYTDPATGKIVLYNPQGMDMGDIASVSKEGVEAVGGTLGAAAGFIGTGANPVGGAIGAGLGMQGAGDLFDLALENMAGKVDTRSAGQRAIDTTTGVLAGAVGQRGGELVGQAASKLGSKVVGKAREGARALARDFKALGITPPAGAVSTSKSVQLVEKGLEATPASVNIISDAARKTIEQTKAAADRAASAYGQIQTKQGAGETIRAAAKGASDRFLARQEKVYDAAFDLVGANAPVRVSAVTALRKSLEEQLGRAPASLKKTLGPAVGALKGIERDAGEEGINFTALRAIRTNIGRDLKSPVVGGSSGSQNAAMKQVYAAITEDISNAAKAAGPEAAKKLAVADRFTRMFNSTAAKTLDKIVKLDADEKAYKFALDTAKEGGTKLARLRRNFTPDEWDSVVGTVLGRMGLAKPAVQEAGEEAFSPSTFMTTWNSMSPEAKKVLFGGSRYSDLAPELDKLVRVVSALKSAEKLANYSGTARMAAAQMLVGALGFGATALIGGDVGTAAQIGVGVAVAPIAAAKLITNPKFVSWLTRSAAEGPNRLSAQLGRLMVIGTKNPEISNEVADYINALRGATNSPAKGTEQ